VEKHSTSQRSPLSPTRWPPEAFSWPRSLLFLVALGVAFYIGLQLDLYVTVSLGTPLRALQNPNPTLTWGIALGQLASYIPILIVALPLIRWLSCRSLRELGLGPPTGRIVLAGIGGAVAMYVTAFLAAAVQYAFTREQPHEAAVSLFQSAHDPALIVTFGALAAVAAPFVEELIFRGFLFNALLRYLPVWFAAAISGLAFGLSHGSLTAFIPLACTGVVLAYVYYLTGSLTASMITHGLFNLLNLVAITGVAHK
jgi:membrane protease YdiL (CAAX protease family)